MQAKFYLPAKPLQVVEVLNRDCSVQVFRVIGSLSNLAPYNWRIQVVYCRHVIVIGSRTGSYVCGVRAPHVTGCVLQHRPLILLARLQLVILPGLREA